MIVFGNGSNKVLLTILTTLFLVFGLVSCDNLNKEQSTGKQKFYAEKYITDELKNAIKIGRFFDIHYFVQDDHNSQPPFFANKAKPRRDEDQYQQRPLLQLTKNQIEIEKIMYEMIRPIQNHQPLSSKRLSKDLKKLMNFAYKVHLQPDNQDYLEALYYHYDSNYHIGLYGKQLPLCLALVGKNYGKNIGSMYQSIRKQNYTNYHIVQIDDNSDDDTIEILMNFLNKYPQIKQRTTLVVQPYQRNSLFNRHYASKTVCQDGDIVIDLDSDDYLIGNQVFQLVNTLYQRGHYYEGKHEQIWSLYFNFISDGPLSTISGQLDKDILQNQLYRVSDKFRTTHLRTYLWKVYSKVDEKDYLDEFNPKKGQFYAELSDFFMMSSVLELSAPKHIKFIDQFVYFYLGSPSRDLLYPEYCVFRAVWTPVYMPLQSLDDTPKRGPQKNITERNQQIGGQLKEMFSSLRQNVLTIYNKNKENYKNK